MTITLKLKPELEARLIAQAARQGISVEELVGKFIELLTATPEPSTQTMLSPRDRAEQFRLWAKRYAITAPPLSDAAISRESIYTREDEML